MNTDDYHKLKKWLDTSIAHHETTMLGAALESTDPNVRAAAHRLQVLREAKAELVKLAQNSEG